MIETQDVELDEEFAACHLGAKSGSYVLLAVSDTGCGMDKETQAQKQGNGFRLGHNLWDRQAKRGKYLGL